jgi:putative oxidoreductase
VLAGTYAEFLLPVMLLLGIFTRLTSVALIGFIIVMSFVDIQFHGLEAESIGMMFDRIHNSVIWDQRLLWVFPLIYLAVKGGGPISVDALVLRRFSARAK